MLVFVPVFDVPENRFCGKPVMVMVVHHFSSAVKCKAFFIKPKFFAIN